MKKVLIGLLLIAVLIFSILGGSVVADDGKNDRTGSSTSVTRDHPGKGQGRDKDRGRGDDGTPTRTPTPIPTPPITPPTPSPSPVNPSVITNAATAVATGTATLNGRLTIGTATPISVSFKYGSGAGPGYASTTPGQSMGGSGAFSANISGLSPNTTYRFCAYVGTIPGNELTFTTGSVVVVAPSVSTLAVGSITSSGATLNGYLTALGTSTTVGLSFEYGTISNSYGLPVAGTPASSTTIPRSFSLALGSLSPNTTYYYRAIAGSAIGSEMSFTTAAVVVPPPVTTPVNQPPVLGVIGNKSVNEGVLLTFTLSASDPDVGDTLTYSNTTPLPSGAGFNASTRVFTWTPSFTQAGSYPGIRFQVSDGALTDFEDIIITVVNVNRAPVLAAIGNKSVNEGVLLTFTLSASDPDVGDTLTYSNTTPLPSGAGFNASTRVFTWTPSFTQAGSYPGIRFQVSDGALTDFEDITITVVDAAPPVSFSGVIQPILANCTGCHNSNSAAAGYSYSTYSSTMASVVAGNAAGSMLYKSIIGSGATKMPPGGSLTSAQIQNIMDWINQGALQN